ncbi:indolepyruvate ferredoxin oxidoreductase subunit alpha [Candidatus Borkfalkia ceftriaxoniphila]|uniref:Indolepyruvate oxidoreductase subunit IorA n=1 Tax=Candidatus Borkfalkia ceftriaxoniphila TaxID=2508949 RepID=A0A4Q2KCT4_9FIRM|nr:indolepyruvate ferredoxin oxidoreductase subunit alpha [Candidatus Borkfalkia ceftriaxoniphila]RXZ62408.1 indolepyruvate ferredoxin oxidoreductase subunit alpha [Candidatus Borkfalkia ceftriaxoniphila]
MKKLLLGDFAVARGAYEAGVKVATAYPGTPSTEITEEISRYDEVYSEWSPNEKVALEVGIGAAIRGARTLVSMKHVGLNVACDPLFTSVYTGVNAGLVIAVADDPSVFSSQNEQDTRLTAVSARIPVIEPSDSREAKDFTKAAFEISEKYDTPVILRITTRVAHSQSQVELCEREERPVKEYKKDIAKYVMMPANAKRKHVVVEERLEKLSEDANGFSFNQIEEGDGEIGIICAGGVYQFVKEALPNASVLKLGMSYPLPYKLIEKFAKSVKRCIVAEELAPHIETLVKAHGIKVEGKNLFPLNGEFSASLIRERVLGEKIGHKAAEVPARPPVLCSGCPHRGVFYVLSKLKLNVLGDIGCYTLGAVAPLSAMDAVVCMGASIGMAIGFDKADPEAHKHSVAVIGDSTFCHSGVTGLMDAVYNRSNVTVIILDNRTTGMTGHQNHPATGKTIKNEPTYELDLEQVCRAVGVKSVNTVDPNDIGTFEKVLKEELLKEEVSVIIAKRPCVLLTKKLYESFVITDKCKNCKMCLKLGCPAIVNGKNGVTIDVSLCTECGLCQNVCKFGAIQGRNK